MAAVLLRGGTGLCVNCIRRELCRLSWRPQVALLSSKTSDPRKQQPRRTNIKKAKTQPAVDVAKLLEQLFSQTRPDTSPTARGSAARTSSRPPPVSIKPAATSRTEHAAPAIPTVAALKQAAADSAVTTSHVEVTAPPVSPKSSSSQVLESPAPTSETKRETSSPVTAASPSGDASYTATPASATSVTHPVVSTPVASPVVSIELPLAENITETTVEPLSSAVPVQTASAHIAESGVETLEPTPATVEAIAETPAAPTSTPASSSGSVENIKDPIGDASPVGTVESTAVFVDSTVESTVDPTLGTAAESVETSPEDIATASPSGDTPASATSVTHPVTPTLQASPVVSIELSLAETMTETTVEASAEPVQLFSAVPAQAASAHIAESGVDTLESTPATVEAVAEHPAAITSTPASSSGLVENIEEPIVDAAVFVESTVESTVNPTIDISVQPVETRPEDKTSDTLTPNALTDNTIEPTAMSVKTKVDSTVESSTCSGTGLEKREDNCAVKDITLQPTKQDNCAVKDITLQPTKQSDVSEAMTLESVTLAEVTALVESLHTDVLFQTTSALDSTADILTQDVQAQTIHREQQAAAETENFVEALSENDSLFEDVAALEAETELLMEALLCSVPASDSRNIDSVKSSTVLHSAAPDRPGEPRGDSAQKRAEEIRLGESGNENAIIAEAMTLESVTLAEVEADVGTLEADVLKETKTALEKEAEILSKEEHTGEYTALKDGTTVVEENAEPDLLTLDSLSEASEALEAETEFVLGALFFSGSGPVPSTKSTAVTPESQSTFSEEQLISQEMASKSVEEGSVLEAMTVESVTLAEVEAVLGTLENEALTEIMSQLEKEAEVLATKEMMGEERKVVENVAVSGENAEAEDLTLDSLTEATEALEVETDVVMQAMICVAGPVLEITPESKTAPPESQIREADRREEVVVENLISEEAVSESIIGGEKKENVLDSMMLESVTLPDIEAGVEILDNVGLTETTTKLEKEAEILSKEQSIREEKTVVKDGPVSEEKTEVEVLTGESLSEASGLPGAQQAEMLMEELHSSAPGQTAVVTDDLVSLDVAKEDKLDGKIVSETVIGGEESLEGEQTVVDEALTLESLTMSKVETLLETLEVDILTELVAEEPRVQEQEKQVEHKVSSEAVEADVPSEAEILHNAEVLDEAAEALEHAAAVILQDLLCSMPGPITTTTTTQTAQPDSPPPLTAPLPTPQPEVSPTKFGQEEEEGAGSPSVPPAARGLETETEGGTDESTQTEALGIDEGWDPVQRLFLEKIREYNTRSRMCGGPVEAGPDYEKRLSEEKAKLHRLYGGGDLESFPQFTFTEPLLGEDSK